MHWIYPIIGTTLSSFGFGGVADIAFTLIIDSYPDVCIGPSGSGDGAC